MPGAVADYQTTASNPAANLFQPVRNLVLVDTLPNHVVLRVTDLDGAGSGPVAFADGSLLGIGLLSSGLTYTYSTATPSSDSLEF